MNLLYCDWNSFGRADVLQAFENLGHTYELFSIKDIVKKMGIDQGKVDEICHAIHSTSVDFVFSMNYFPMVSEACNREHIPYLSWIYDNPYQKGYSVNIINPCNYIFTFDSAMYEDLASQGVSTIFYAPLAANPEHLCSLSLPSGQSAYKHDISFVGALYNEDHNFYDEFVENAGKHNDSFWIGYIDALIQTQLSIYGTDIITSAIPPELPTLNYASINPWDEVNAFFTTPASIFADNVLCRKITSIERLQLLEKLSMNHSVDLYTRDAAAAVGNCNNYGYADYRTQMPEIFRTSKINLNITLRSIKKGIPLRAIEIMGAGGFLLTNYQSDLLLHFEPDVDFVYYESIEDACQKAAYYLTHEEEREQIAANGLAKIRRYHTYEKRLEEMLHVLEVN
ncbi:MAG: DUF3880 domain-containing protein [Eubacterium sp.]